MSHCLNPDCHKPEQHDLQARFCRCCGSQLRLRDRYRALRVIGQGGFGKTFLARDEVSGSPCVIKQFLLVGQSPQVTQKAIALFQEEAKRLEKLGHHSQIPEFYDYLEQNNRLYIVQEFIEGETLTEEVSNQGAFTEQKIRQLLGDLLPVLEFIHQGQVIHRDIKPDNIIRRKSDQKFVLVDFGAAKEVTKTALMKTGTIIGTLSYTATEQAHGKAVFASDIFSLGVTCIYLLTQVDPFQLYDPIENQFIWRNKLIHPVDRNLLDVIEKMTHSLVKERFQTATDILKNLKFPNLKGSNTAPTLIVTPTVKTIIQGGGVAHWQKGIIAGVIVGSGLLGWQLFSTPSFKSSVPLAKIPETPKPLVLPSIVSSPSPIIKASSAPSIKPPPAPIIRVSPSKPPPVSVQSRPKIVQKAKPSPKKVKVSTSTHPLVTSRQKRNLAAKSVSKKPVTHSRNSGLARLKQAVSPKRIVQRSPSRTQVTARRRVPSQTKTRYTTSRKPSYTVYKPKKKTKVALGKKRSTQSSSLTALKRTIQSDLARRSRKPTAVARRRNVAPSVPRPWEAKSVPNPASELENTIRNGQ